MASAGVVRTEVDKAARCLRQGGVVAYPTEYCFGLGCDPRDARAVTRILKIKRRRAAQGLILAAATTEQLRPWLAPALFRGDSPMLARAQAHWPGPVTWILPAGPRTSRWVRGSHRGVAVRVSAHPVVKALCRRAGTAIVSTSANRHGKRELRTTQQVLQWLGDEVDFVLDGRCFGATAPSALVDAESGRVLRGALDVASVASKDSNVQKENNVR